MAADEPVNKKLIFDDLASPVKRDSFIASPKQPIRLYCRVRPQLPEEVSRQETPCLHVADAQTLVSVAPEESFAYKSTQRGLAHRSHQFNFTKVFGPPSTQQDVFNDAVTHILKDFLEGQNSLLFSYGVTNSGKTHTICGCDEDPGILPRVMDSVFVSLGEQLYCGSELRPKNFSEVERLSGAEKRRELEATASLLGKAHSLNSSAMSSNHSSAHSTRSDLTACSYNSSHSTVMEGTMLSGSECSDSQPHPDVSVSYEPSVLEVDVQGKAVGVWVSCAEIYNEFVYDLFTEIPTKRVTRQKGKDGHPQRHALRLAEDKNHNVFIKGLKEVQVTSVEDAKLLVQYGQHNRRMGSTLLNQSSSRSHCIFTIKLIRLMDTNRPKQAIINRMSIVDLAGSERSRKTKGNGQVVKEAGSINVSLHILGKCITALRQNQRRDKTCVPFRESKLTQVFQNYFVGKGCGAREGRVTMFVNVSPSPAAFDESLKVLEVSAIASKVVPYVQPRPRGVRGMSASVGIENAESTPVHEAILRQHSDEELTEKASGDGVSDLSAEVVQDDQATPSVVVPEGGGGLMAFITPAPHGTLQPICPKCEHYQSLVKKWKEEIVELKLKLWEQEGQIRSEVCREFQNQVTQIREEHNEELMEQVDQLEAMHEQRVELLTRSIRKVVQSKKRRREEGEEESEMESLRRRVKELEKTLAARDEELEEVKSTMKHLRKEYESSMVEQNGANNDLAVRALSLEKKLSCLEDENAALAKEKSSSAIVMQRLEKHNTELLEQLNLLEDEKKESECLFKENTLVMEEQLRVYKAQLGEARQEASKWEDDLKQLQLELDKMAAEKRGLSDEVVALTHSLDEHRAQSAKREAEWVESKEVVRGALGGQVVELQRQLSAVQAELSGTRQAAKEKEEELTQLYKKGISSEQFAVLEQKLEKSCATEKALRTEVTLWKTELQELKASSEKEVASLKAHKDLEVGELNVRVRELSRQLQLASTSSSAPSPPAPTVTVQCSTTATEGKPIAKRTRRKRCTTKPNRSNSSDNSSPASTQSASDDSDVPPATNSSAATSVVYSVPSCDVTGPHSQPSQHKKEHIYDEPYADCDKVEDSTHTHLPNIETSSQLLEPDQSLTSRREIDVTYAKVSKAQRKRKPPAAGSGPTPHSSIPVKCKRVELEEVFPLDDGPSPSKRTKPPTLISVASRLNQEENQSRTGKVVEDENNSTPKSMSLLRKKLGKVMSKSAGRKGKKLADSTNLGEGEGKFVSPMHTRATPSPRLSRTAGHKRRITKSQISGPLDLIASPAVDVKANQPRAAISWDLRRKARINYAPS